MQIWNTLTGKKEPIEQTSKPLRLFVCGPTVYDYIHVGNARTYAVFDTLVRFLRFSGVKVFYLQNVTDIDDKIIKRANEEHRDWKEISKTYTRAFREDAKALRITSVDTYAPATKYIGEIVRQVQILIKKGHAYEIPGDLPAGKAGGWYFDVSTFPDYGKLAKRTKEMAEDGVSRIDENIGKRNRADFTLWKYSKPSEPVWKTKLGKGRPGWHIEDTAITEKFFGPQYDLHGAGIDLIFPHHEAEIAQQESASGKKPFVKTWMHVAFFDLKGAKMSKSLGNVITARDFLKKHNANTFRYIVAAHHYRTRIEYNEALAMQAEQALGGVREFLEKLRLAERANRIRQPAEQIAQPRRAEARRANRFELARYENAFSKAMGDDLNTPQAFAALFDLIAETNKNIWNLAKSDAKAIAQFLRERFAIFGIALPPLKIPAKIKQLVKERELSRRSKQFARSDALRKEIERLGWKLDDTPIGPLFFPHANAPKNSASKP